MAIAKRGGAAFRLTPVALAILVAGTVSAQTAPVAGSTLPEVQVTAPSNPYLANHNSSAKATAPLVDTPQTIQVIPKEVFNEQGARNLTDALRNTPGITFNAGENGFSTGTSNFSLRGFDASANIFIDGFRDSGSYNRDAYNLEQVEVVKGPAADNGRGGAGGYVNLETKTPKMQNFVTGTVSYGFDNYDSRSRQRASADVNRVIGESTAVRLNLLTEDSGVAGREHAKLRTFGFAPSVSFGLGTPTTVTLAYQHTKQKDRPDWGVPGAMLPGNFNFNAVAATASRDNFYGLQSDFDETTADALLARIEHKISPNLTLSNHTRWSQTERSALYAVPTGYNAGPRTVTTQRQGYSRENTSLSNLTNLTAIFNAGGVKHTVAAGLELSSEKSEAGRFPTNGVLGNPGTPSVFSPDPSRAAAGFVGLNPTQRAKVDINTVALYAYDTIELSPQWEITGGLRAERYSVTLDSRTVAGAPVVPFLTGFEANVSTIGGKAGVVYKPASNGSIYASYSEAALPPGSFLSGSDISREGANAFPGWNGQNHANSKEQRSSNVEVGTKWEFLDRRLSTTAALFRTERKNIGMGPAAAAPVGYGKQIVTGLEFGIAGAVTREWSVFGGLTLLNSERQHNAAIDAALSADYTNGATTTSGDQLAFTPRAAASFWTTYRLPIGLTLGGGAQYVGSSFVGRPDTADRVIPNGQVGKLPSYTVFNLMASYEVNKNLSVRLNIDNVGDKLYAVSSNWNATRVSLGAPRSFLLSADLKF
jgi:catecholate siderophore receptor